MRMLSLLFVLPLCAAPALAAPPTPPPTAAAAQHAAATPSVPASVPASHHRYAWERQFVRANTSHDGHLTLQQAVKGYITVARHFRQIDVRHRGYVTLDDIRAWHRLRREAHHRRTARVTGALCPQPAFHRTLMQEPLPNGPSETQILAPGPSAAPPAPAKGVDPNARS